MTTRLIGIDVIKPAGHVHAVRVEHHEPRADRRRPALPEVLCDRDLRGHRIIEKTRITGTTLAGELA